MPFYLDEQGNFYAEDGGYYYDPYTTDFSNITPPPVTTARPAPTAAPVGIASLTAPPAATASPVQAFKNYMYQGIDPNDHATATVRGLQYAQQQGWSPEQTVNAWNQALGTNFTTADYYRATGTAPATTAPVVTTRAPIVVTTLPPTLPPTTTVRPTAAPTLPPTTVRLTTTVPPTTVRLTTTVPPTTLPPTTVRVTTTVPPTLPPTLPPTTTVRPTPAPTPAPTTTAPTGIAALTTRPPAVTEPPAPDSPYTDGQVYRAFQDSQNRGNTTKKALGGALAKGIPAAQLMRMGRSFLPNSQWAAWDQDVNAALLNQTFDARLPGVNDGARNIYDADFDQYSYDFDFNPSFTSNTVDPTKPFQQTTVGGGVGASGIAGALAQQDISADSNLATQVSNAIRTGDLAALAGLGPSLGERAKQVTLGSSGVSVQDASSVADVINRISNRDIAGATAAANTLLGSRDNNLRGFSNTLLTAIASGNVGEIDSAVSKLASVFSPSSMNSLGSAAFPSGTTTGGGALSSSRGSWYGGSVGANAPATSGGISSLLGPSSGAGTTAGAGGAGGASSSTLTTPMSPAGAGVAGGTGGTQSANLTGTTTMNTAGLGVRPAGASGTGIRSLAPESDEFDIDETTGELVRYTAPPRTTPPPTTTAPPRTFAPNAAPTTFGKAIVGDTALKEQLALSSASAFDFGEGSTFNDPGVKIGEYTVKQNQGGGGYTAFKSEQGPQGKPIETSYTYDADGNITGSEVRYFVGDDSGAVYKFDEQGNPIGQPQGFDYSEEWKGPVGTIFSMIAPALGPYGMLANAAFQAGQGNYLAAIASGAGAGAGIAGTGTFLGVPASTFQNVGSLANAANAIKNGDLLGAAIATISAPFAKGSVDSILSTAGLNQTTAGQTLAALDSARKGNWGAVIGAMGNLAKNSDVEIAGNALAVGQAIKNLQEGKGTLDSVTRAFNNLTAAVNRTQTTTKPGGATTPTATADASGKPTSELPSVAANASTAPFQAPKGEFLDLNDGTGRYVDDRGQVFNSDGSFYDATGKLVSVAGGTTTGGTGAGNTYFADGSYMTADGKIFNADGTLFDPTANLVEIVSGSGRTTAPITTSPPRTSAPTTTAPQVTVTAKRETTPPPTTTAAPTSPAPTTTAPQVTVTAKRETTPPPTTTAAPTVTVTGKRETTPPPTTTAAPTVTVTGKRETTPPPTTTEPPQTVTVTAKRETTTPPPTTTARPPQTTLRVTTAPPVTFAPNGFTWPQAVAAAGAIGMPSLANVFYYGKDFGSKKQKLTKKGTVKEEEYTPLSVSMPGVEPEQLAEQLESTVARGDESEENQEPVEAARGGYLDSLLSSSMPPMSHEELVQILLRR